MNIIVENRWPLRLWRRPLRFIPATPKLEARMPSPLSRFLPVLAVVSALPLSTLTGCGAATSFTGPSASSLMAGRVIGGQQPVSGSLVTVWAAGTDGYGTSATQLAHTTTASDGTFTITTPYTCTAGEQVYITAAGGQALTGLDNPNIMLATGLGDCAGAQSATVEINEVTTAATAFALTQFFTTTLGDSLTDVFGTNAADLPAFTLSNQSTIPLLVDIPSGTVNPNTPLVTIESAKIYSIANTLAACVNDATPTFTTCATLYTDTTPPVPGATAPSDTLQAAVQINLYPYQNVTDLYKLAAAKSPFTGLGTAPNDWTIGVSYTSSSYALSIAGTSTSATSASIDIDANGNIWFPTNLSSSTGVAFFNPASTSFNGPYLTTVTIDSDPIGFLQPQYLAIDNTGLVWLTDESEGLYGSTDTGSIDAATPGSGTAFYGIPANVTLGPIAADATGDIYFSEIDLPHNYFDSVANPATHIGHFTNPPTGLVVPDSSVFSAVASTSGSGTACLLEIPGAPPAASTTSNCTSGGLALASGGTDILSMATSLNQLCFLSQNACGAPPAGYTADINLPEGVATDGYGNEWIANSGNSSVFTFGGVNSGYANTSPVAYLHDASNGNTMTTPYAIAIDGSGNVWIANAGCVGTSDILPCTPGAFVLSELIGAAAPTITPLSAQMVNGGILVGTPPGTVLSLSASSSHHRRFGSLPPTKNPADTPNSATTSTDHR
jgi:hypothetical protein